jgi:hypothetical protein
MDTLKKIKTMVNLAEIDDYVIPAENVDHINPKHYKDIVPGYQYMEMMQHMLKEFNGVEAHLLGQIYKYQMRLGKKDSKIQDLKKAQWYMNALLNYYETGEIKLD